MALRVVGLQGSPRSGQNCPGKHTGQKGKGFETNPLKRLKKTNLLKFSEEKRVREERGCNLEASHGRWWNAWGLGMGVREKGIWSAGCLSEYR